MGRCWGDSLGSMAALTLFDWWEPSPSIKDSSVDTVYLWCLFTSRSCSLFLSLLCRARLGAGSSVDCIHNMARKWDWYYWQWQNFGRDRPHCHEHQCHFHLTHPRLQLMPWDILISTAKDCTGDNSHSWPSFVFVKLPELHSHQMSGISHSQSSKLNLNLHHARPRAGAQPPALND